MTLFRKLPRLLNCVRHLGFNKGFRYWRLQNACLVDPGLALRIASAAEREAVLCYQQAASSYDLKLWEHYTQKAECFESWAALVRRCHAEHVKKG